MILPLCGGAVLPGFALPVKTIAERARFEAVLAKIPDVEPEPYDK